MRSRRTLSAGQVPMILAVACAAWLSPGDARSQAPARTARIGYLSTVSSAADAPNRAAFTQGMRELGYVEGRNVVVEARHADGNSERLPGLAADLARGGVDVIVAATTPAVRAARRAAPGVPVVMAFAGDPVGDGLVASLARPGGNVTGLSAAVTEVAAKRVEFLHDVVPHASHFVLLAAPAASRSMVSATEKAGEALGVRVSTVLVRGDVDVARALDANAHVDGVIVDLAIRRNAASIIELARERRVPTVSGPREFAADGGLLAYGANYPELYRRAAAFVDRILRGANPADLAVEQPTKFDLVVNLGAAKTMGIAIPASLVARADEVIR